MQCVHMSVCECGCVQVMERVHVRRESQAWTQLVRLTQQALLLTGPIAPFSLQWYYSYYLSMHRLKIKPVLIHAHFPETNNETLPVF